MINYYLCSVDIAKQYCTEYVYKPVHHCGRDHHYVYFGWLEDDDILFFIDDKWGNGVLLKNIDEKIQIILTLIDPVFRKLSQNEMSAQLRHRIKWQHWITT